MPKRLSEAEAVACMRNAGLELLESYTNAKTPWRSRCMTCRKEVTPATPAGDPRLVVTTVSLREPVTSMSFGGKAPYLPSNSQVNCIPSNLWRRASHGGVYQPAPM